MQDTVIVGEAVSGKRAEVQKALKRLIKQLDSNTFDVAELLYKATSERLYIEPTVTQFYTAMGLKPRKAQYLTRIVEVMTACGIERAEYEPIGIGKLRIITRPNPLNKDGSPAMFTNAATNETFPMKDYIVGLVELAKEGEEEDVLEGRVHVLMGETGDNDMAWLNIRLPRIVRDGKVKEAFEKAAINIGTVRTDAEGMAVEVPDWRKLEVVCVEYVNDQSTDPEIS